MTLLSVAREAWGAGATSGGDKHTRSRASIIDSGAFQARNRIGQLL